MGDEGKDIGIEITQTQDGFSSQEYQVFDETDFPDGNITDQLHLGEPEAPLAESDLPDGKYYIKDFPFNIAIGDDLKAEGPRPVEILTASKENELPGANDSYTGMPFAEGDKVAFMGQFNIPLGVGTLRDLLIEEQQEKPATPADITITDEEVVEKTK